MFIRSNFKNNFYIGIERRDILLIEIIFCIEAHFVAAMRK